MTIKEQAKQWDVAGILALVVTLLVALATVTPYIWVIPKDNMNLVTQGQTTLYAGWMIILAFYYKSRGTNPQDAETISNQAKTIKEAQSVLVSTTSSPSSADQTVKVEPDEKVVVKGVESTRE